MSSMSIATLPRMSRERLAALLRRTAPTEAPDAPDAPDPTDSTKATEVTEATEATEATEPSGADPTDPIATTGSTDLAIIDVRDSDHIGGHIRSSIWVPTSQLDTRLPELIRTLKDTKKVVFHCALSQQRGPSAALRYVRDRDRVQANTNQEVFVLDGGFVEWQERYGNTSLTEAYVADIWASY